jgi:tetratricopeptide (TPR) repeat protein
LKSVIWVLLLSVYFPSIVSGQEHHGHSNPGEKLGSVSFPISCSPSEQRLFERGVALLHSFEYAEAGAQFQAIEHQNQRCAMAFWGEAMSLYHQFLWMKPPTRRELEHGADLIARARQASSPTQRERDYIDSLAAFYHDPESFDLATRTKAYSDAMEKVYRDNPGDGEAAAFYGLSLIEANSPSDTDLETLRKAIAVLSPAFELAPDHPGLAHYIIHAADNPKLAPLGLEAARKYAAIAPSSPHALHMPGHIFARLGLWQEDINSNLASLAAARAGSQMHIGAEQQVHAMEFLQYAYLQIGDDVNARKMIDELKPIRQRDVDPAILDYINAERAHFAAIYDLERHDWKAALAEQPPSGAEPVSAAITYWAHAVAAGHLRDAAAARTAFRHYEAQVEAEKKGSYPYRVDGMKTYRDESRAWAEFAENQSEQALQIIREVADRQDQVGKREVDLPAREMAADMLLLLNQPMQALAEYKRALQSDPNRFNELSGAANAAQAAGEQQAAEDYFMQLVRNCVADSDRPELTTAKRMSGLIK